MISASNNFKEAMKSGCSLFLAVFQQGSCTRRIKINGLVVVAERVHCAQTRAVLFDVPPGRGIGLCLTALRIASELWRHLQLRILQLTACNRTGGVSLDSNSYVSTPPTFGRRETRGVNERA